MKEKPRLLFVDDEAEILDLLTLTFRDFETDSALNTEMAMALLRQKHFDVLITDIRMPGTSGLTLIEHAAKIAPGIAVIVITGHHQETPEHAHDNVIRWILKPFSMKTIRQEVLDSLNRAGPG